MKNRKPEFEFSRPLEVARVPNLGSHEKISADSRECAALAKRLKIEAVHSLSATLHAKPWRGGGLKISGSLTADVEQVSVISLEAFRHTATFPVERYFLPSVTAAEADDDRDIDTLQNGVVDLGEMVTETLALELDPYPRKPGEVFEDAIFEDEDTEKVKPFAVLSKVKPGEKT